MIHSEISMITWGVGEAALAHNLNQPALMALGLLGHEDITFNTTRHSCVDTLFDHCGFALMQTLIMPTSTI